MALEKAILKTKHMARRQFLAAQRRPQIVPVRTAQSVRRAAVARRAAVVRSGAVRSKRVYAPRAPSAHEPT